MKNKFLYLLIAVLFSATSFAQVTNKVQADSFRVFQVGGHSAELIIENATKNKTGAVLKNRINGRTEFDYVVDSTWLVDSILFVKRGPVTSQYIIHSGVSGTVEFKARYSIVKGTGDSAQLVNDTIPGNNTIPLAYQILNGRRGYYPVKADTADIFGIDSSLSFNNVAELRTTQLYSKGARFATTSGYSSRNDGGGSTYSWNSGSTATDDSKFIFKPNAISSGSPGRWEWVAKGIVRAAEVGVKSDGTDQLSTLSALFNLSTVKGVLFDNGNVTFAGKLSIPSGKKLIFQNDSKLQGNGGANDTLNGGIIVCDVMTQCLDTSITPLNLENALLSVRWLGADGKKALWDNYQIFNKAQVALKQFTNLSSFYNFSGKIYIPRDDSAYYFSRPLILKTSCEFYGDGEIQTMLSFPADSAGITLAYAPDASNRAGIYQDVHDFTIRGAGSNYVHGANGLTVNNLSRVRNVTADFFSGDGFLFFGSVPIANANNAHASLITAQNNRGNGIVAKGPDANVIIFDHINAGANWQYGAVDSSFLGCTWIQPHAEDNGFTSPYSRVRITDATHTLGSYWAKRTPPIGMKPGVTPGWQQYWHPTSDTTLWPYNYFPVWDTTIQYLGNGAYSATDNNARSAWFSPYVEGNQGGVLFSGNSTLVYGGLLACDDYTATDDGGSAYQYIKASGSTRPGILVRNVRSVAANGWNTNHNQTYGGIEMRTNESASYGFTMGGIYPGLDYEHFFGGISTGEQALTITSALSTATYGRPSSLPTYSSIFHNGFYMQSLNNSNHAIKMWAAADPTTLGTNNANGDKIFNANPANYPRYFAWQNSNSGTTVLDTVFTGGFIPMYSTSTRPTSTTPRIVFNTTTGTYQAYTPGTGWVDVGSGGGGGTPGGSDTYLQFNNAGAFGGNADLAWDNTNSRLSIGQQTQLGKLNIKPASGGVGLFIRNTTDADISLLINSAAANEHIFYGNGDAVISSNGQLSVGAPAGTVSGQKMYVRGTTGKPNAAVFRGLADSDVGFSVNGSAGSHHLFYSNGDVKLAELGGVVTVGAKVSYKANYGASFTARSLVDKNYVDSAITANLGGGGSSGSLVNLETSPYDSLAVPVSTDTIGLKGIRVRSSDGSATVTKGASSTHIDYDISIPIASGNYNPTVSNGSNVTSSTTYSSVMYTKVGSVVTVSGKITIQPTASGAVSWDLSLPIATSNFTTDGNAGGAGQYINGSSQATLKIYANASAQTVKMTYRAPDTALADFYFTFQYTIQ